MSDPQLLFSNHDALIETSSIGDSHPILWLPVGDQPPPRRPVLLNVHLSYVPDILEEYQHMPEAHQLTCTHLPDLPQEEEKALLTFVKFFKFEVLSIPIRTIVEMVADQICGARNTMISHRELWATLPTNSGP